MMRSLFLKIFLWFWATVILTGIALVVTFILLRAAFGQNMHVLVLHWLIAFLVSGGICYLLTRYITRPILRLSAASRQLAEGNLKARAGARMEKRRDEIGGLVKDFNRMAERTEELIHSQRQLITDISHELRSPLARLNVALDLARERKGDDPAFAQMDQDIDRLADMVGRILIVARLDSTSALPEMAPLNFSRLLSEVAADADFEAQRRGCTVQLSCECDCVAKANSDLLRSAFDNVVRNAVRYTSAGTTVEIRLSVVETDGVRFALVSVRDHGPGVLEKELSRIFHPFYRLAEARDRQSGGAGLGLAIASRVVELHGGKIRASNAPSGGLQVDISIPAMP